MSKEIILKKIFGKYDKVGNELLFHCPKCKHHKNKLSINLDRGVWKCWICDYSGRKLEKLVKTWGGYYKYLEWCQEEGTLNRVTQEMVSDQTSELLRKLEGGDDLGLVHMSEPIDLPESFKSLSRISKNDHEGGRCLKYLIDKRGLTYNDIIKWKIGFCATGDYRDKVIVPSFNINGECDYYVGRSIEETKYKYKNPKCDKTNIIFNELFVDWYEDIVLVEGIFDAIKAGNAIPLLGSTINKKSRLFKRIIESRIDVYLGLDNDAREKEDRIISLLLSYGVDVYKIDTTQIEDIGSITKEHFAVLKEQAKYVDKTYLLYNKFHKVLA